jgi:hypothetical protein
LLPWDCEVVTTQACDKVLPADPAGNPGGDLGQKLVSTLVVEGVVDGLEVVDVHEQQGNAPGVRLERPAQVLRRDLPGSPGPVR